MIFMPQCRMTGALGLNAAMPAVLKSSQPNGLSKWSVTARDGKSRANTV
jgi:hypothetical protein